MSDRVRLRVLLVLEDGELCVGDVVQALDLPQANVSRHLAYLQKAALVAQRAKGQWRFYRLDPTQQPLLMQALFRLRDLVPEAAVDRERLRFLRASGRACCPDTQDGACA